jgi:hypothetical protein
MDNSFPSSSRKKVVPSRIDADMRNLCPGRIYGPVGITRVPYFRLLSSLRGSVCELANVQSEGLFKSRPCD